MVDSPTACRVCGARNRVPVVARGRPRCGKCSADLPWLVAADTQQFPAVVSESSIPVLVDLWAPWCGPCRSIAPVLEQLAADRAGTLRVVKVNVDEEPSVSAELGVQGIPTMVLYQGGEEIGRQVGALPAGRIADWVDSTVTSRRGSP